MATVYEKLRIMVVDDELEIQKMIGRYLAFQPEFADTDILYASSFNDAMEKLESLSPLVVLQDINLPDGNGLQFIKQAKRKYPVIQFIVITGASDLDRVMEALSFGAVDYIKKPLDLETLGVVVREAKQRCDRWGDLLWNEYTAEMGPEEEAGA